MLPYLEQQEAGGSARLLRSIPARSSTHSSDPSPYWALCSSSCSTTLKRIGSDSITVISCAESCFFIKIAKKRPAGPPPSTVTFMT